MKDESLKHDGVSATEPDWSREHKAFWAWVPSKSLLASIRLYQQSQQFSFVARWLVGKLATLLHRFWSVVTGADIPITTKIGGGLLIPHPNGIVIHPDVVIGPNCLIFQQVTIGATSAATVPVIGGHVDIGAGAKVLGAIQLGNHVRVGANAVVTKSVAEGKTVVGIPARVVGE
jgi:serine O-acetyltransferase